MADFEIRDNDTSYSDYIVTDLDSGAEYDVSVTHYGSVDVTPRSRKASVLPLLVLWIALSLACPSSFYRKNLAVRVGTNFLYHCLAGGAGIIHFYRHPRC